MSLTISRETNEYRLLMLLPGAQGILVEPEHCPPRLPRLVIPKGVRAARALQQLIEDTWRVNSIVLDVIPARNDFPSCAVVEIRHGDSGPLPRGVSCMDLESLNNFHLRDEELSSLRQALSRETIVGPPFRRLGWVDEAMGWIRTALKYPPEFNGHVQQLNVGGSFALVRFGTSQGPAYWLKAVGSPNESEFTMTTWLAERYPQYLPPIKAARSDWNTWVMEEVGTSLSDSITDNEIDRVGTALADFQRESETGADEFLTVGCSDQRTDTLRNHITEVFHYLSDVLKMEDHRSPLSLDRLKEIEGSIRSACDRIERLGIPDAINSNDLKLANILCDDTRCVFTDWCHSYVGNPFLTFQHLHTYLRRTSPPLAERFRSAYGSQWRSRLDGHQIRVAFALAPPLAAFAYLCGNGRWLTSSIKHEATSRSHSLLLLKHLNRATGDPHFLEALCG